jgi:hypothetical protein
MKLSGYTALAENREGKLFRRDRVDIHAATTAIEANVAVNERENRVIATEADVFARLKFRTALANNDVAGKNHLAAKSFYAESLADAVAAVLNAALSFFMCHWKKLSC